MRGNPPRNGPIMKDATAINKPRRAVVLVYLLILRTFVGGSVTSGIASALAPRIETALPQYGQSLMSVGS